MAFTNISLQLVPAPLTPVLFNIRPLSILLLRCSSCANAIDATTLCKCHSTRRPLSHFPRPNYSRAGSVTWAGLDGLELVAHAQMQRLSSSSPVMAIRWSAETGHLSSAGAIMGVEYLADPELILCHFTSSLRCPASQRQVSLCLQHEQRKVIPKRRPCWTSRYQNWANRVMRLRENQLGLGKIGSGAPYRGASIEAIPIPT
jgi:hypothetical protein